MKETSILQGHRRPIKLAAPVTKGVRSMPSPGARGCGPDILTEIGLGGRVEALIEAGVVRVEGVVAG